MVNGMNYEELMEVVNSVRECKITTIEGVDELYGKVRQYVQEDSKVLKSDAMYNALKTQLMISGDYENNKQFVINRIAHCISFASVVTMVLYKHRDNLDDVIIGAVAHDMYKFCPSKYVDTNNNDDKHGLLAANVLGFIGISGEVIKAVEFHSNKKEFLSLMHKTFVYADIIAKAYPEDMDIKKIIKQIKDNKRIIDDAGSGARMNNIAVDNCMFLAKKLDTILKEI